MFGKGGTVGNHVSENNLLDIHQVCKHLGENLVIGELEEKVKIFHGTTHVFD